MCATACFDIGYKVSDDEGEMSALSTSSERGCPAWYDVLLCLYFTLE